MVLRVILELIDVVIATDGDVEVYSDIGVDFCERRAGLTTYGWNFSAIYYGIIPSNPVARLRRIR